MNPDTNLLRQLRLAQEIMTDGDDVPKLIDRANELALLVGILHAHLSAGGVVPAAWMRAERRRKP